MKIRDLRAILAEGDIFILNPGEPHRVFPRGGEAHSYQVLVVDREFVHGLSEEADRIVLRNFIVGDAELASRMKDLLSALLSDRCSLEREGLFYSFIDVLIGSYATEGRVGRSRSDAGTADRVRSFIDSHVTESISLARLSSTAGLSPYHLNRLFCAEVGMAPHEYQLFRRIERSRALLDEGKAIIDVALELGFADQSHFSRFFRRIVGTTPGNYMKHNVRTND